jgi:hypothetical protein
LTVARDYFRAGGFGAGGVGVGVVPTRLIDFSIVS